MVLLLYSEGIMEDLRADLWALEDHFQLGGRPLLDSQASKALGVIANKVARLMNMQFATEEEQTAQRKKVLIMLAECPKTVKYMRVVW